jgi:hypothetical protein
MEGLKGRQVEIEKLNTGFGETKEFEDNNYNRRATLLKLQWIAERARKIERIRKELEAGSYHVDSRDIAKALLCLRED